VLPIISERLVRGTPWRTDVKIDGNRPAQDTEATDASRRTAADRGVKRSGADRPTASSRDRVEVSSDAQLLTSAINATNQVPAVRTELVERLRQKLNAGELGKDSARLADRIIDDLLNR
jgi:flagellar biosynthesis anti-sigma factor FlgM